MDLNTVEAVAQPTSRDELAGWREGDAWLAGGTWLFSEPQPRLRRLVDLVALGWPPYRVSAEGLHLAATCTFAELVAIATPPGWIAASLIRPCCEALLGSFKIWNVASVRGNLCLALPAAPVPALAGALDATCLVWTPAGGERTVPALDFVTGAQRNALRPGEVLRAIDIPAEALTRRAAFRRASLTPLGRSAALLIGTLAADGRFRLTVTAATDRPVRLAWPHLPGADELRAAIDDGIPRWCDDVHGRPDWRRHMTLDLGEEIRAELSGATRP